MQIPLYCERNGAKSIANMLYGVVPVTIHYKLRRANTTVVVNFSS